MFTGIIKLAQIDDYIAPSQSCIQPKIMKKDKKEEKATVTLNDCLACSGCITSAESILIEQMSIKKFTEFSKNNEQLFLIISPQSLLALSKYYKTNVEKIIKFLHRFLQKYFPNVTKVYSMEKGIQICHQFIYEEFVEKIQKQQQFTLLCSECPGWVCYAQKTLQENVTQYMSQVKSPQQAQAILIKKKYPNVKTVSITPCYDKKLEAIRFSIDQKTKQIDLTLASTEIVQLITQTCGQELFLHEQFEKEYHNNLIYDIQNQKQNQQIHFLKDQTSNGYIEYILKKLQVNDIKISQIKNSDFIQYSFTLNEKPMKMAKCYGFRNIQKVVQQIKKGKCEYKYIEIMACPSGCFGGGGQPRYEGVKAKEIVKQIQNIAQQYPVFEEAKENLSQISKQQIYVKYKPIEKSMSQSVMNW